MANVSYGQVEFTFSDGNADTNGTVDIDVTASGFNNIFGAQFTGSWDSLVMRFNSIVFTNPDLTVLTADSFGTPSDPGVDEGQFTFSYFNGVGDGGSIPDGSILFTVRFDVVGAECAETAIEFSNSPLAISAFDNNLVEFEVTTIPGTMMVNGTDCEGGGDDELTFSVDMINAEMGTNICIPITVQNFINIQAGMGTILWDSTVLSYTGLGDFALLGLDGSLNDTNTDGGELKFVWSNPEPTNPITLADGETVFELCFDVIGEVGDMSPITLSAEGNLGFEWTSTEVNDLPLILNNGKVTVTEMVGDPFVLNVSSIDMVDEDATNVCVDISVENFENILSMQFVITWDEAVLSNATPSNFNLASLNSNSFNIDGNCATMSWNVNTGIDVADDTAIFSMCFDIVGPCESSGVVDIISKGNTDIQIVDGNTEVIDNVDINPGSVTVECNSGGPTCSIISTDRTCRGMSGGNVIVSVEPDDNCTYSWANGSGMEISTEKNLLGVPAGTYILTVTCDGAEACTLEATIENHPDLVIDGDVMDAGCGDLGSIDVTVSLGSGNYSYTWNPAQDDSPNISGLEAGPYALTVTDEDTGCTQTASYTVVSEVDELILSASVVIDETCMENNGSISLTVVGGCEPYSYSWSDATIGNTPFAQNLTQGEYTVTITDDSNPAMMIVESFPVEQVINTLVEDSVVITPSTGMDGTITLTITGGTPMYSYSWMGSTTNLPNSNALTGLMEGMYNVTVTDADGCVGTFGPYVVLPDDTTATDLELENVVAVTNEDGFSVLCNGDTNGSIAGTIIRGDNPFTVELSGDESRTFTVDNIGVFTIDDLAAGTYTVTVSNSFNTITVENIEIAEPDALTASFENGCDSEEQCDGFIDVDVMGGSGDLTFEWSDSELSGASVDGLCQGTFTVLITDENGCQFMDSVEIESCEGPVQPGCYEVRDVITPNGDGMNDQFMITCIADFPATLEVYDRWGKLVYNQDSYDGSWMGISNSSEELIEGGYMYILNIDFGDGRREIMKGTLTLLRD